MSVVRDSSIVSTNGQDIDQPPHGPVVPSNGTAAVLGTGLGVDRPIVSPQDLIDDTWPSVGKLLVNAGGNRSRIYLVAKRILDILGALAVLVLFSVIFIPTWLILFVATKGNPFFSQERVGFRGRRFRMYKFRTMSLDAEAVQQHVANEQAGPIFKNRSDPRITRIGAFLRKTSIDEIPQLINVLRGEMSLVGPRPPVAKEVAQYEPWQRERLSVKPGLTCLWQVSGRSDIAFDQWMQMDIWYVGHQTMWTDIMLLVRTPIAVLTCRGSY